MYHQILQCFRIHAGLCHIGTICMSANMRGNIGHLNLIDFIVPADHMIESVFPMHGYKWHSIFVQKKKSRITIYHLYSIYLPSDIERFLIDAFLSYKSDTTSQLHQTIVCEHILLQLLNYTGDEVHNYYVA